MGLEFLSCFRRPLAEGKDPERLLNVDEDGYRAGCIFCSVSADNGFAIEYEDDDLIAFRDRAPRAAEHILIIPRRHAVSTVHELTVADIPLIEKMQACARTLRPARDVKTGFHIPPFSSVHHLHLHVLVPPLTALGRVKYPVRAREDGGKKWTWFVTPSQVVSILEAGGRVGLGSCPGRKA